MEDASQSRLAEVAQSPPGRQRVPSPAVLQFAKWLRRFGYVVLVFYLAWITLGPGDQDTRLPPDLGRMISSGLLTISVAAIFFGILIVWGERQRLRVIPPPVKQTRVPRRFGVGGMLFITTMYAALFSVLSSLRVNPLVFVIVSGFFTIIGLSQAVLFKGRNPRKASIMTGMALGILPYVFAGVVVLSGGVIHRNAAKDLLAATIVIVLWVPFGAGLGVVAGYLAGLLISGAFALLNTMQPPLPDPDEEPGAEKIGIPKCDAGEQATADERG